MKPLWIFGGLAFFVASAPAQTGTPLPAPASTPAAAASSPPDSGKDFPVVPYSTPGPSIFDNASAAASVVSGQNALADGFTPRAIDIFQAALAKPGLDGPTKDLLNIGLATAFLAQGQLADASNALKNVTDTSTSTPAYLLRTAMLSARNQDQTNAALLLAQINAGDLPKPDRPLYYALRAVLAGGKDLAAATTAWQHAIDSATTQLQKNQFEVSLASANILHGATPTQADADNLYAQASKATKPSDAAKFTRLYAVMLDQLGRRAEALDLIKTWLNKTSLDPLSMDYFRVTFALIDSEDPQRPNAVRDQQELRSVLQDQLDPGATGQDELLALQKTALGLIENTLMRGLTAANADPSLTPGDPQALQDFVGKLIHDQPAHPLLKQLRLLQAYLALGLKQDGAAEDAAQKVLALPADPGRDTAREDALRLLAMVEWSSHKYRSAADFLHKLLETLPASDSERNTLTTLMADLYFLNGDYTDAGTYYSNLLTSLLSDSSPSSSPETGLLLVRAVESEIRAGQLEYALTVLNQAGSRADIDPTYRWQAEFDVLSELRNKGRESDAFKRLALLLGHGADLLPAGLRLRLRWLDASLAVGVMDPSAGDKAQLLQKEVEAVMAAGVPGVDGATLRNLAASALFLQAEAAALTQKPDEEQKFYDELTQKYPDTESAIYAVFSKASELSKQNQTAQAQRTMKNLGDSLAKSAPDSRYLPEARYYEAVYAAERGQAEEAEGLFDMFAKTYPDHPRFYDARLQQALLDRTLNRLDRALGIYNDLLNIHTRSLSDPLAAEAAMGRVNCLIVMAGNDPGKRKDAMDELERLYSQELLPVDDRVKAGLLWGNMLETGPIPDPDKALDTYWTVIDTFLKDDKGRAALFKSEEGISLMSECLFYSARIYENEHKEDLARAAYEMVIKYGLANQEYAKSMLANPASGAPPPEPNPTPPPALSSPSATQDAGPPAASATTPAATAAATASASSGTGQAN